MRIPVRPILRQLPQQLPHKLHLNLTRQLPALHQIPLLHSIPALKTTIQQPHHTPISHPRHLPPLLPSYLIDKLL